MPRASSGKRTVKPEDRFLALFLIWYLRKQPAYGYKLAEEIRDMGLSPRRQSTVYAILSRLERLGFIRSWNKPVGKRVRKMFRATAKGAEKFEEVKERCVKGPLKEFLDDLVS